MGTRPDFTTSNVITDSSMTDAFKQGFTEGQANRDLQIVWKVTVSFEGIKLNEKVFEDQAGAINFVLDNTVTVGQEVVIEVLWNRTDANQDSASALEAGDDEIVDAEVVEEN
jgi:hypothetical protein